MKPWGSGPGATPGLPKQKVPTGNSNLSSYYVTIKEKGGICSVDIGTSKENMVALRWPTFSGFYGLGWAWGGGALLL